MLDPQSIYYPQRGERDRFRKQSLNNSEESSINRPNEAREQRGKTPSSKHFAPQLIVSPLPGQKVVNTKTYIAKYRIPTTYV